MYDNIKEKRAYDELLATGMFWEFYPELTGAWNVDKVAILGQPESGKYESHTKVDTDGN